MIFPRDSKVSPITSTKTCGNTSFSTPSIPTLTTKSPPITQFGSFSSSSPGILWNCSRKIFYSSMRSCSKTSMEPSPSSKESSSWRGEKPLRKTWKWPTSTPSSHSSLFSSMPPSSKPLTKSQASTANLSYSSLPKSAACTPWKLGWLKKKITTTWPKFSTVNRKSTPKSSENSLSQIWSPLKIKPEGQPRISGATARPL